VWKLLVSFARAAHTQVDRIATLRAVLAACVQWGTDQLPSLERDK